MYKIIRGTTHNLADVEQFIDLLNQLDQHKQETLRTLFDSAGEIIVTRAPGRLDLMGGFADYSGSLVLQMPLAEAALVGFQRTNEPTIQIISLYTNPQRGFSKFSMPLSDFMDDARPISYHLAQRYFQRQPQKAWAAYVAGAFLVLMREFDLRFTQGARILIHSAVPTGKGVGSSAALEVAVMSALAAAHGISLIGRELALLCQKIENLVVGAPCGIMDQMSSACGEENELLALLCQPAEIQGFVSIPSELTVWGIDSGIRHTVAGADYSAVRVGTFMGYRILQELAGTDWDGYLANLTPSYFEQEYAADLPLTMRGTTFIERYDETTDTVTTINPKKNYAVLRPTAHAIYEHFRVQTFGRLLQGNALANAQQLGELMYQSHASYTACGLGAAETDVLVRLARKQGVANGIYGAKITGSGSGGTVAILGRADAENAVQAIAAEYAQHAGLTPQIFRGSSMGAATFGALQLGKI